MRILVDSADRSDVLAALGTRFVAGVTMNPTLQRSAGLRPADVPGLVQAAVEAGAREVHVQVLTDDAEGMVRQGRELVALDPDRIHVKLVATPAGYRAAAVLAGEGVPVTLTAVYTLRQVTLAIGVGARSVAIYLGRMRDSGADPMEAVGRMQALIRAQDSDLEVLAASIRDVDEVGELGLLGVASATLSPALIDRLLESDATAAAAAAFARDADALEAMHEPVIR